MVIVEVLEALVIAAVAVVVLGVIEGSVIVAGAISVEGRQVVDTMIVVLVEEIVDMVAEGTGSRTEVDTVEDVE